MMHAKFQDHRTGLLVLEKKIFKGFCHIWARWPSWSCDYDYYKIYVLTSQEGPTLN